MELEWKPENNKIVPTVLYETRTALDLSGLTPPYILMPHSLWGIEALAWASCFPLEVRAIIGLDAGIPDFTAESNLSRLVC